LPSRRSTVSPQLVRSRLPSSSPRVSGTLFPADLGPRRPEGYAGEESAGSRLDRRGPSSRIQGRSLPRHARSAQAERAAAFDRTSRVQSRQSRVIPRSSSVSRPQPPLERSRGISRAEGEASRAFTRRAAVLVPVSPLPRKVIGQGARCVEVAGTSRRASRTSVY